MKMLGEIYQAFWIKYYNVPLVRGRGRTPKVVHPETALTICNENHIWIDISITARPRKLTVIISLETHHDNNNRS
jgi:hypothetical protein